MLEPCCRPWTPFPVEVDKMEPIGVVARCIRSGGGGEEGRGGGLFFLSGIKFGGGMLVGGGGKRGGGGRIIIGGLLLSTTERELEEAPIDTVPEGTRGRLGFSSKTEE